MIKSVHWLKTWNMLPGSTFWPYFQTISPVCEWRLRTVSLCPHCPSSQLIADEQSLRTPSRRPQRKRCGIAMLSYIVRTLNFWKFYSLTLPLTPRGWHPQDCSLRRLQKKSLMVCGFFWLYFCVRPTFLWGVRLVCRFGMHQDKRKFHCYVPIHTHTFHSTFSFVRTFTDIT